MLSKTRAAQYAFLILGILFSLMMVLWNPRLFYYEDQLTFWNWVRAGAGNWKDIYLNCPDCNYPIIGTMASAGVISLLGKSNLYQAALPFRIYLGVIDGLNILLIFFLFKKLSIRNAPLWAGLIGILPSSWVGGALWGQIDSISQLFLLTALLWIAWNNVENRFGQIKFRFFLVIASVLLAFLLLTKQLAVFNLFSMGLLLAANILFTSRSWKRMVTDFLVVGVSFGFMIFFWDIFLKLRKPFFSHLYYIFRTGSDHGNYISGNGFNIWMFLGRNMWSSSRLLFFSDKPPASIAGLVFTPFGVGILLFLAFCAALTLSLVWFLKPYYQSGEKFLNREVLLNVIAHLALVNLSYNVLLSGTHERYLYHFYPFILLACLGLMQYSKAFSKKMIAILVLGSILYGGFVYLVLSGQVELYGYNPHWILGTFDLGLLIYLSLVIFKYQNFRQNTVAFYRDLKNRKPKRGLSEASR